MCCNLFWDAHKFFQRELRSKKNDPKLNLTQTSLNYINKKVSLRFFFCLQSELLLCSTFQAQAYTIQRTYTDPGVRFCLPTFRKKNYHPSPTRPDQASNADRPFAASHHPHKRSTSQLLLISFLFQCCLRRYFSSGDQMARHTIHPSFLFKVGILALLLLFAVIRCFR